MTTGYIAKWTPFIWAAAQRSLQQGSLNVGTDYANRTNLYNLAVINANGAATWARWRAGGYKAPNGAPAFSAHGSLLIFVQNVPGYVSPVGTND